MVEGEAEVDVDVEVEAEVLVAPGLDVLIVKILAVSPLALNMGVVVFPITGVTVPDTLLSDGVFVLEPDRLPSLQEIGKLPPVSFAIKALKPMCRMSSSTALKLSSFNSVKNLRKNFVQRF